MVRRALSYSVACPVYGLLLLDGPTSDLSAQHFTLSKSIELVLAHMAYLATSLLIRFIGPR